MNTNRDDFFTRARSLFGGRFSQSQVDGLTAILDGWDERMPNGDMRWLAYMLATAFHETARTMQPVKEAYWLSENWRKANLRYYPYYGRGYVQLTWKNNYSRASAYVGADLAAKPDLALRPDIAAVVMFAGMVEGWFRGDSRGRHTLSRYFNVRVDDPVGARDIINGREVKTIGGRKVLLASVIAGYHEAFLSALSPARAPAFATRAAGLPTPATEMARNAPPPEQGAPTEYLDRYADLRHPGAPVDAVTDHDAASFHMAAAYGDVEGVNGSISDAVAPDSHDLVRYTVELVSAYISHRDLKPEHVPTFIASVHAALRGLVDEDSETSVADEDLDGPVGLEVGMDDGGLGQFSQGFDTLAAEESARADITGSHKRVGKRSRHLRGRTAHASVMPGEDDARDPQQLDA